VRLRKPLALWPLLALLVLAGPARSQGAATMREAVYEKLSQAEAMAQAGNYDEALGELEDVRKMKDLNSYEVAQLYTAYGFIHFSREDWAKSIEAYEKVLHQEDLPDAMRRSTVYTLAQLHFQAGQYEKAIESLNRWLQGEANPGPQPYILLGQAYYQLQRYADAVRPVETAISIAKQQGTKIEENWYLLLRVFYYELENYPKVVEVLETLVREHPRKEYWLQLAAMYGEIGDTKKRLAAYDAAYAQGFLDRGSEITLYAQLLLQEQIPYRAGVVLQKGIDDGLVEKDSRNYRLLSQSWTLAKEDAKSIAALQEAAALAEDGELDARLAQAWANLGEWEKSQEAARRALSRGVERADQVQMVLGMALYELDRYEDAKNAFRQAQSSPGSRQTASQWINYIDQEQERLASLERNVVE